MKQYKSIEEFGRKGNAVVTIGTFDGVHLGHRKIITRLCALASEQQGESVVLTFFPHPRMVLYPDDHGLQLLNTLEERIRLIAQLGVHHLIVQPFTTAFSRQSSVEFVRNVLMNSLGTQTLVIGYDHHFGRNREGTYKELEELAPVYGFELEEIHEEIIHEVAVSSTKIRKALEAGDVAYANELLGYEYMLTGSVKKGDGIGRQLGFPTANIIPDETFKLIPATGIYAVQIKIEAQRFNGMLYIGTRPTFDKTERNIEVNIFDFEKDIYGKDITVIFKQRIRDDERFSTAEELSRQLANDKLEALKILK
ncbi:MAG: bifunctional riboflavin kinase/FAD synthetase [Bacteroidia bacterium]|nr:bifunctional riboflavin kinase/FAD synthetase [Bacteroidia bacterium]